MIVEFSCATCGVAVRRVVSPSGVARATPKFCSQRCNGAARRSTCTVDGCDTPARSAGLCQRHYSRRRRTGHPEGTSRPSIEERLHAHIDTSDPHGCHPWTGHVDHYGYGILGASRGRTLRAHRLVYERHHGPIPAGLVVMHTCDNPPCCRPDHLRAGTQAENLADMRAKGRGSPPPRRGAAR